MPKKGLDTPNIRSIVEEVGGEAMTEGVRVNIFNNTGDLSSSFYESLNSTRRNSMDII